MTRSARWPIAGHDQVLEPLLRSVRTGSDAHAYLISGPPRTGKSLAANLLIAAYVCIADDRPCGACPACLRVQHGAHPDVEILSPGGICDEREHDHSRDASRDIRICQTRRAERLLNLSPLDAPRRLVLIDPAEAMNMQSADAFLKTLEEPPGDARIILVTAEPRLLSETIRSRCREVRLGLVPPREIEEALIATRGIEPDWARLLARLSAGQIAAAFAANDDPSLLEQRGDRFDTIARLAGAGRVERLAFAEKLANGFSRNREDVYSTLTAWVSFWRDVLLIQTDNAGRVTNIDRDEQLRSVAGQHRPAEVARLLLALREARRDLEMNVSPRMALDALMLRLPAVAKGGTRATG